MACEDLAPNMRVSWIDCSVLDRPWRWSLISLRPAPRPLERMVSASFFESSSILANAFAARAEGAAMADRVIFSAVAARVAGMPRLVIMARAAPIEVSDTPKVCAVTRKPVPRALLRSSMRRLPAPITAFSVPTVTLKLWAPLMPDLYAPATALVVASRSAWPTEARRSDCVRASMARTLSMPTLLRW